MMKQNPNFFQSGLTFHKIEESASLQDMKQDHTIHWIHNEYFDEIIIKIDCSTYKDDKNNKNLD